MLCTFVQYQRLYKKRVKSTVYNTSGRIRRIIHCVLAFARSLALSLPSPCHVARVRKCVWVGFFYCCCCWRFDDDDDDDGCGGCCAFVCLGLLVCGFCSLLFVGL